MAGTLSLNFIRDFKSSAAPAYDDVCAVTFAILLSLQSLVSADINVFRGILKSMASESMRLRLCFVSVLLKADDVLSDIFTPILDMVKSFLI